MNSREDLKDWILEALRTFGGKSTILDVCKYIWKQHEMELKISGDLFFTWQYDVRWAAQMLRNEGILKPVHGSHSKPWELAD